MRLRRASGVSAYQGIPAVGREGHRGAETFARASPEGRHGARMPAAGRLGVDVGRATAEDGAGPPTRATWPPAERATEDPRPWPRLPMKIAAGPLARTRSARCRGRRRRSPRWRTGRRRAPPGRRPTAPPKSRGLARSTDEARRRGGGPRTRRLGVKVSGAIAGAGELSAHQRHLAVGRQRDRGTKALAGTAAEAD